MRPCRFGCPQACWALAVLYIFSLFHISTQRSTEFRLAWIAGDSTVTTYPSLSGTKGVPSQINAPSVRTGAIAWYDSNRQEVWIFGGSVTRPSRGIAEYFNDLWRYRVGDDTWTWMSGSNTSDQFGIYGTQGIPSSTSIPGSRHSTSTSRVFSWMRQDELWLFGGYGFYSSGGDLNDIWKYSITEGLWTWMAGSSIWQPGVYGTQGLSSSANTPGSRTSSAVWYDKPNQELWLFGGYANYQGLNDLWKYSVSNNTWTWVGGTSTVNSPGTSSPLGEPSTLYYPSARAYPVAWSISNEVWIFGGQNAVQYSNAFLADLWRYRLNDSTWTRVTDSATFGSEPPSRAAATGWVGKHGDLWLYGGYSTSIGYQLYSDLWRFQINSSRWIWVSGTNSTGTAGNYGSLRLPSTTNFPPARTDAFSWFHQTDDEFWFFGGNKYGGISATDYFNDLWRYRAADNTWTWMYGSNTPNSAGSFGTRRVESSANMPPNCAQFAATYDDLSNSAWLFGGQTFIAPLSSNLYLPDLWRFQSGWTWVSNVQGGHQRGPLSPSSFLASRYRSAVWHDSANGEVWLFGGSVQDPLTLSSNSYNDLWRYRISDGSLTLVAGTSTPNDPGEYPIAPGSFSLTSRPSSRFGASTWSDWDRKELWLLGGCRSRSASTSSGCLSDMWVYLIAENRWNWVRGPSYTVTMMSTLIGVPSTAVNPTSRGDFSTCYDAASREVWLVDNTWTVVNTGNYGYPVYGTRGVEDPTNTVYGRDSFSGWCNIAKRELWLFGGSRTFYGYANDLWRYNITSSAWTWISGAESVNSAGAYEAIGSPCSPCSPSARSDSAVWYDPVSDKMWVFGAFNNDLWSYHFGSDKWTWMGGAQSPNQVGVYNDKGVPSTSAIPSSRSGSAVWFDSNTGIAYILGGDGLDSSGTFGTLNDLWILGHNVTDPVVVAPISSPADNNTIIAFSGDMLEAGAVAAIAVVVSFVFIAAIVVAAILLVRRRNRQAESKNDEDANQKVQAGGLQQQHYTSIQREDSAGTHCAGVSGGETTTATRPKKGKSSKKKQQQPESSSSGDDSDSENVVEMDDVTKPDTTAVDSFLADFKSEWMIGFSELKFQTKIGQGAFGMVYKGKWRGSPVAIKQSTVLCVESSAMQDFKREALLMLQLPPHPNCVRMLGICVEDTNVYVIMEMCSRGSLDALLKAGRVTLERKLKIISGIAAGVWNLHHNGVVHRDLAARNILLGSDDTAKVSDFGMSRMLDQFERQGTTNSNVGPIRWMAPESLDKRVYSPKSDVWAWANTVVEILNEKEPYHGMNLAQVIPAIVKRCMRPPLEAECPEWLLALLNRCWSRSPDDRPSMEEIMDVLDQHVQI